MTGTAIIPPEKNVRRYAIGLLACLLSVCLAAVMPGCESSNKKKAQEYLQAGADRIQEIRNQATEWQNRVITTTGATDLKTVKNSAEAVRLSAKTVSETIGKARAEYQKITRLRGVGDYVKYARLRLAQLDLTQQMLNRTQEYLDKKVTVVKSGDLVDLASVEEQYSNEISKISDEIQKIEDKATKMKKDERL
jgi:hypothetical protein